MTPLAVPIGTRTTRPRWHLLVGLALVLSLVLAAAGPNAAADVDGTLRHSPSSDRSDDAQLHGATLSGDAFVWYEPTTSVRRVDFYVDDPSMSGHPVTREHLAPYDLAGTEGDGGSAALDTTRLEEGTHTVTVEAHQRRGRSSTTTATFTVANGAPPGASLAWSPESDRTGATAADDSTVSGDVHVFLDTVDESEVDSVAFTLAGPAGPVDSQTEYLEPYDMAGTASTGDALGWDTTTAENGDYTVTAVVETATDTTTLTADLTVDNGSDPAPEPTTDPSPEPTTDPSPEPTTDPSPEPTTDPSPEPAPEPSTEPGDDGSVSQGRQALLDRRVGFGRNAGDGATGWQDVVVSNLNSSGSGSLQAAVSSGQRWVSFADGLSGTISIGSINLPSDIVIDGRGADITLGGSGPLTVRNNTHNVIVSNLSIAHSGQDGFFIRAESHTGTGPRDIWLDHLTFASHSDECIDISAQRETVSDSARPRDITLSWLRFNCPGYGILAGSGNYVLNSPDRITMHHSYFRQGNDRQPRVVAAQWHSYNNWHEGWGNGGATRAVSASIGAELLLENNVIDSTNGNTLFDWPNDAAVRGIGNLTTGGAEVVTQDPGSVFTPPYPYTPDPANQALRDTLAANAGAQG